MRVSFQFSTLQKLLLVVWLTTGLVTFGCNQQPDTTSQPITNNLDHDHEHEHKHFHRSNSDHEHEHEDGHEGAHSHPHIHGHRHGKPIYGGKIVSLGHTHHTKGATHYHAEILPTTNKQIVFHVLIEDKNGKLKDFSVQGNNEVEGFINEKNGYSLGVAKIQFAQDENAKSKFTSEIPDRFDNKPELMIVIPKIQLGTEKLDFSFKVRQKIDEKENAKDDTVKAGDEKDSK